MNLGPGTNPIGWYAKFVERLLMQAIRKQVLIENLV
jgi:hypothetical protein